MKPMHVVLLACAFATSANAQPHDYRTVISKGAIGCKHIDTIERIIEVAKTDKKRGNDLLIGYALVSQCGGFEIGQKVVVWDTMPGPKFGKMLLISRVPDEEDERDGVTPLRIWVMSVFVSQPEWTSLQIAGSPKECRRCADSPAVPGLREPCVSDPFRKFVVHASILSLSLLLKSQWLARATVDRPFAGLAARQTRFAFQELDVKSGGLQRPEASCSRGSLKFVLHPGA